MYCCELFARCGDCEHSHPEQENPTEAEMLAEGWHKNENGVWQSLNEQLLTTLDDGKEDLPF